jgi:hypothetical protein
MTYEQFMVDLRVKNAQAQAKGVAFTVPAAMRCAWEAGIAEGRRVAELEHSAMAEPEPKPVVPAVPAPVDDAADRLGRVTPVPGLR